MYLGCTTHSRSNTLKAISLTRMLNTTTLSWERQEKGNRKQTISERLLFKWSIKVCFCVYASV